MSEKKKTTKKTTKKKAAASKSASATKKKSVKKRTTKKKVQKSTASKGFSKKELVTQGVVTDDVPEDEVTPVDHLEDETSQENDDVDEFVEEDTPEAEADVDADMRDEMEESDDADMAQVEIGPSTSGSASDDRIDKELTQIYENKDGSMPDMKQFNPRRKHRFLRALGSLLVSIILLGVVAYLGFFVFQPQIQFSQNDVIFSISGDEEIMSGEEVRYRIRYRNAQTVPLAQTSLQVRYPEGFVYEGSSIEAINDTNTEWALGTLEPGEGDYIDIWGRLYGSIGERQSLRAFLNYTPSNFSSEFQKVESLASEVTTSTVDLLLTMPEQIALGAETQFTLTISPKLDSTGPLLIALDKPANFMLKSSEPAADEDNQYEWSFEDITEDQTILLTGVFEEGETATMGARALQWKDESRQTDGYTVGATSEEAVLISTDLTANLVINGTLGDFSIQPGETMNASLIVKNIGETDLENVSATLVLDAPSLNGSSLLNWPELVDEEDGSIVGEQLSDDVRRGSIAWNRFQIPEFQSLAPGEEVIIDVSLALKTINDIELPQLVSSEILVRADVQFDKEGERDIFTSNQLDLTVNSDVALDVQQDVDENKRTIRWIVTNSFHDLESLVLEADLFGEITWLEDELVVPAGEAVYDEEAQSLVWTVDQMPTSVDVLALQFAIEMGDANPSQTNLASKIRFTAVDTVTGETITLVGDEVLLQVE